MKLTRNLLLLVLFAMALPVHALDVNLTTDGTALGNALNAQGLTINSVTVVNGAEGQFGTYSSFNVPPITIGDGIVLSSGHAGFVGGPPDPELGFPEPNWSMEVFGTPEFDAYGPGRIENFAISYDVAAVEVNFTLATNSQVKFDFVFGSVEYPYWTGDYTDAFLVFLNGTDPTNQIVFDDDFQPIQVGLSFAGQVETNDQNTAFGYPHGIIGRLTTTTAMLPAGTHTLRFEVGDVNDDFLDSAAFIANLRAGSGDEGTDISVVPPPLNVAGLMKFASTNHVTLTWTNNGTAVALESADLLVGPWTEVITPFATNANWISAMVTNNTPTQFFRLRKLTPPAPGLQ